MTLEIRPLTEEDTDASRRLSHEAFGGPARAPASSPPWPPPGYHGFGAFEHGELVAKIADREYDSHFGGAVVPTCGIAGVTVVAERRGEGLMGALMEAAVRSGVSRGCAISTLFPTVPAIYRPFGFETITDYQTVELPTAALAEVAAPQSGTVAVRRASAADFDTVRQVYDRWAAAQNGPLTRRGVSFPATAEDFIGAFSGVTVAVTGDGAVEGYLSWRRLKGYGSEGAVEVADLLAVGVGAARALLRFLGSMATTAPAVRLDTSGFDLIRTLIPTADWKITDSVPYMLRLLDVPGALAPLAYPYAVFPALRFQVVGDRLGLIDGSYRLEVASGAGRCERDPESTGETTGETAAGEAGPGEAGPGEAGSGEAPTVFTPQGLALMYAGTLSMAGIRATGHASGGSSRTDGIWDALFGGRQAHVRDYF
jgi:predicted acetyltransferase